MIMTAAALGAVNDAGYDVLTMIECIEEDEFLRSRLTRHEVRRQLHAIAAMLEDLRASAQQSLPEIDWAGWAAVSLALRQPADDVDETAWFAARSLLPATLMWLKVYRQAEPALFDYRP